MSESSATTTDPFGAAGATPPGRGDTAHVYVREAIRLAILNGHLVGGTRLVQSDLATQLRVSTTPVREALRDLASEGLIRIDPHRGAVVSELDEADLIEVYKIRRLLEPLAIEIAMPLLTDAVLARAAELHAAMSAAPNSAAWVQLNREFHMTIYEVSSQPRLLALIRSLQDASVMAISARLQRRGEVRVTANDEHGELLDALRSRDLDQATAIILHHVTLSIRD